MKFTTFLGVAAAVGVVLFLRSEKGRQLLGELSDNLSDLAEKGQETLNDISKKVNAFGKEAKEAAAQPFNA